MISQKMIDWGSQGCGIREIAAYGEARAAVVGAENVFNFTIGNPSVKAPDCVARSIRHLLDTVPPEVLHGYTPAPGFYAVRQAMAEQLTKSFRTPYRAEDIFMTSGACAALAIICAALIGPGEEAVTLTPYFSEYRVYVEAVGGRLVEAPSDPKTFQIDLAAVEAALSPRTALVLLNSPNNPSGVVLERSGLEALAALLRRKAAEYGHPIYIVADEPYRALVYGGVEVPFIPDLYADTVYCTSFSKSLSLAGERVGYLAVAEQVAEHDRLLAAIAGAVPRAGIHQRLVDVSAGGGGVRRGDGGSVDLRGEPGLSLPVADGAGLSVCAAGRRILPVSQDTGGLAQAGDGM